MEKGRQAPVKLRRATFGPASMQPTLHMVEDTDWPMEVKEPIQDPVITGQMLAGILTKNADNGSGWPMETEAQQPLGTKKW